MKYLIHILFMVYVFNSNAQMIFYQDICKCGVTAGGFSTGLGSGSGAFDIYIEPGSTIKKAYAFTYRIGFPPSQTFIFNGNSYVFDTTKMIMNVDYAHPFASPLKLYYMDITSDINPVSTNNTITIPDKIGLPINWGYWSFFCILYMKIQPYQ